MKTFEIQEQQEVKLATILQNAIDYAFSIQHDDGYWIGRLDSNSTMEAEYLMLLYFLGIREGDIWRKVANHILSQQREDGTWGQYFEGPGDLSTTVECYFALKLAGISAQMPRMQKAKEFIISKGGLAKTRVFTKIWLALFKQWPWDAIPLITPEIIYLPHWFLINIYSFASWARATIVPLSIVLVKQPLCEIPEIASLKELCLSDQQEKQYAFAKPTSWLSWRSFFYVADKALRLYEKLPYKFARKSAINKALKWIINHQEADGSWGGIQPPWVYSLIALKICGYDLEHPVMKKGLQGFQGFSEECREKETLQIQACISPVWDTCLMMVALQDAAVPSDHPRLQQACKWLMKKQIRASGDWHIFNRKVVPGGWAFEFDNNHYPDIDDTSEVLIAILRTQLDGIDAEKQNEVFQRGLDWLINMQSRCGGWAAFDRDNDNPILTKILFFDFGETLDPPSVDVTAHVLELLGRKGYQADHPIVRKALNYVYQEQESDGSWFGRWGVNYIYGTGSVLPALEALGEDMNQPCIHKAVQWLIEHQNDDGGWGESCASYVDREYHGKGPSTPSQTSWALLALFAAGQWHSHAVREGIHYLIKTQNSDGTWDEPYYTGCGFPGYGVGKRVKDLPKPGEPGYQGPEMPAAFMINYNLYRHYWPLMALGRYYRYLKYQMIRSTEN